MVDIHTHILYNIDDGPKTLEESMGVLRALAKDGVTDVVATSHYFSGSMSIEKFTNSSQRRIADLKEAVAAENLNINIKFGAEVFIDSLLLNHPTLKSLCIEGTENILLEIPDIFYKEEAFDLLDKIVSYNSVKPIIAHVERYRFLRNAQALAKLKEMGCSIQVDAQCFFDSMCSRHFGLKMIKKGLVDVIASDCHNTKKKRPNLSKAYALIEKKLGKESLEKLKSNALRLTGK